MSRIVIVAVGSRGDVAPLTSVGVALRRSGYDVAIAAYTPFADMIADSGSTFLELPAASTPAAGEEEANPMKGLAAFASPKGMRALAADILASVADQPADLLLLSPFAEMASHAKALPAMLNASSAVLARFAPEDADPDAILRLQRPALPFFTPAAPARGMPERWIERSALYAGDSARRIDSVVSAAEAVAMLTPNERRPVTNRTNVRRHSRLASLLRAV